MSKDVDLISDVMRSQFEGLASIMGQMIPKDVGVSGAEMAAAVLESGREAGVQAGVQWAEVIGRMQSMWTDFQVEQISKVPDTAPDWMNHFVNPAKWVATAESVFRQLPFGQPDVQKKLWDDALTLANAVFGQYGMGPNAVKGGADSTEAQPNGLKLPRTDSRFSDPEWRRQPFFAFLHQAYLMMSEQMLDMANSVEGLDANRKAQLLFTTRAFVDALSPANFPMTNPVALSRAAETGGESFIRGFEHFLEDIRKGQLTHTQPGAFVLGENIAVTPGKVVFETPLFQLIQYTPTTPKVLKTPLLIFPPWINRFYILDLNAKKSLVRWAVEQGITVFMVSWKSADASMADMVWDDYIAAQIEAVDAVRDILDVPSVHTVGYCVAGTTLAATLAVLAKKGQADKIASATFFTAQVDFAEAGDLKNFVDDQQIEAVGRLSPEGYLDGRYLAATFNILRGNDLIWSYVEKNYLKGEEYPAFDLLHWNGDVTNLPARWHKDYLSDLYRDNRLVEPDSLTACGESIDLRRIRTPVYIQAGRDDHIAPPQSVWKLTRHLDGPWTFLLAGSGHIAGVVNPPSSGRYQYWTNDKVSETLDEFIDGATEHPGSWWPHWANWLRELTPEEVAARGKRKPGSKGTKVIEDAPGRYVAMR